MAYAFSSRFFDWLRFQSLGTRDFIVDRLGKMFIEVPPEKILWGLFGLSSGLGSLLFLLCLPNLLPGLAFGILGTVIGWKLPKPIVNHFYQRRTTAFVLQMVDSLSLMSNGLKSGLSIVQSIALVVQEMPNPIKQEFQLVLSENRLGLPLEEAFTNLSTRIPAEDVEMFVTSINILKETGGNLAETFDTIVSTIRDRIRVESKIQSMTAAGFFQGMTLLAVPPALGLMMEFSDPDMMRPLFTTIPGLLIILVVMGLETAGFFVIMKVVNVDV